MEITKTHLLSLALVFLVWLAASICKAGMNGEVSIEKLTERAEVIVLGKCLTSYSDWNEQKTEIYTYTLIEVLELLKGKVESPLIVETLGGAVGDLVSNVIGAPTFTEDQKVLLFLFRKQNGQLGVIGLNKGKFDVYQKDGQEIIINPHVQKIVLPEDELIEGANNNLNKYIILEDIVTAINRLISK